MIKRQPIRTDLETKPRCTSRFASYRCRRYPGHAGLHDAGEHDGIRIEWGSRKRKRP